MAPPVLRVTVADAPLRRAMAGLRVAPAQRHRVGAIADLLADVVQCPGCEPMAIMLGGTPVGYARLDPTARSVAVSDLGPSARGLRSFFIDARWQGRGLGSCALALLLADVAARHPDTRQLALTVDDDNAVALRLYHRAGFVDSGARYHGGPAGSQRLLTRTLP